jgi:hypothetical protein
MWYMCKWCTLTVCVCVCECVERREVYVFEKYVCVCVCVCVCVLVCVCVQGIIMGEVSLYHWPPVWPVLHIKTKIVNWFQTSQTGGHPCSDTSPFSIPSTHIHLQARAKERCTCTWVHACPECDDCVHALKLEFPVTSPSHTTKRVRIAQPTILWLRDISAKRHLRERHLRKVTVTPHLELALPVISHLSHHSSWQAGLASGWLNWGRKALS